MKVIEFLHGLGVTRNTRFFDDCVQEAKIELHKIEKTEPDAKDAFKRQAVKWAVYNFLNKQLAEDIKVFKLRLTQDNTTIEDRIVERMARESEYRELTDDLTPLERIVYVLSVSSPLNQAQIAATLDVSDRSVRRTLVNAQKKIKLMETKNKSKRPARAQESMSAVSAEGRAVRSRGAAGRMRRIGKKTAKLGDPGRLPPRKEKAGEATNKRV